MINMDRYFIKCKWTQSNPTVKDNGNITANTSSLPRAADGISRDQKNKADKNKIFSVVIANVRGTSTEAE